MAKHGWCFYQSYFQTHDSVMGQFGDFIESDGLDTDAMGDNILFMHGDILCQGGIKITVAKSIEMMDEPNGRTSVRTRKYSYNVSVSKLGNVFRYCSPHDDHNAYHHRHQYDVFGPNRWRHTVDQIGDDDWPTLGEVVTEARAWFYENQHRLQE